MRAEVFPVSTKVVRDIDFYLIAAMNPCPFASISVSNDTTQWGSLVFDYTDTFVYSGGYPAPIRTAESVKQVTGHVVLFAANLFSSDVGTFHRIGGTLPQSYNATQNTDVTLNAANQAIASVGWTLEVDTSTDGYADAQFLGTLL